MPRWKARSGLFGIDSEWFKGHPKSSLDMDITMTVVNKGASQRNTSDL